MKIFNDICFENFEKYTSNIKNMTEDIIVINLNNNISISIYSTLLDINNIIHNYSNITFIYLEQYNSHLIEVNNLSPNTKLYIVGVDTPSKLDNYSINVFNYEVYFENGTQIKNFNFSNITQIKMSSSMKDLKLVLYDEAVIFSKQGYDIYNINGEFFQDYCLSVYINNNDVVLSDRIKDFRLDNISFCNEGCKYNYVNLTEKRFICNCNIKNNNLENGNLNKNNNNENDDIKYSDYLLSFINYRIGSCIHLLSNIKDLFFNLGFICGIIITITCLIEMFIFIKYGMNKLKQDIYDNIPTSLKLENLKKEQEEKRIKSLKKRHRIKKKIRPPSINVPPKRKPILSNLDNKNKLAFNDKVDDLKNIDSNIDTYVDKNIHFKKKRKLKKRNKISPLSIQIINSANINNNSSKKVLKNISKGEIHDIKKNKSKNIKFNNNLKIDLNFERLIIFDDSVENDALNEIPYSQAIRLDKRTFYQMAFSMFKDEVDILNLIFMRHIFSHLSLLTSIYLMDLFLDVSFNSLLYTEDDISEKYHNNGKLEKITSFLLSIMSNIISSIITYVIEKLTQYYETLEFIINDVKSREDYLFVVYYFMKRTKIYLSIFYVLQFLLNLLMTYYMTLFCEIYKKTQVSMLSNYLLSLAESIILSLCYSLLFSLFRFLSLKYRWKYLYNSSKYLLEHF